MMRAVVTLSDAKAAGLKRYFTGKPCKRGHVAERSVSAKACLACHSEKMRTKGAESRKAAVRRWREKNPDHYKEFYANSAAERERCRGRRKAAEASREDARQWRARNPAKVATACASRRARKLQATPPWQTEADRAAIAALYAEARRMTEETGILHHVDHIAPLRGRAICGLHVPGNLQVIPANDNLRKSNGWAAA